MARKRKIRRKGAGLGEWASKQMINQAKAAAKAHVLPLLKKHLAAFEKKLGGQLRRKRKAVKKTRRRKKAGSSKVGGSSRAAVARRPRRGVGVAGSSRLGGSSRL